MLRLLKYSFSQPKLYLFPGQGGQEKGMFDWTESKHPEYLKQASRILNLDLQQITSTDSYNIINKPHVAQPLIVLCSLYFQLINKINVTQDDYLIGHSIGQYAALLLSQSITFQDCMKITKRRGELIQKYTTQESGMLVVIAKKQDLESIHNLIEEMGLEIGCHNTLTQLVVSGTRVKTRELYKRLREKKVLCTFLQVEAAFHCSALKPMVEQFQEELDKIEFKKPIGKVIRNYDCKVYQSKGDIIEGLTKQLYNPVRFYESVLAVPRIQYLQVYPKPIATRFIKEIRKQ